MLFGYPIEANADNWLHYCLHDILYRTHVAILEGRRPSTWPTIIDVKYRDQLKRRTGLKNKLAAYRKAYRALANGDQLIVHQALSRQNHIKRLLAGAGSCVKASELPVSMVPLIRGLFDFAFDLLGEFGIRDKQYRVIYDRIASKVCPFCGLERFSSWTGPREADDHYLSRSIYPYAAANLWNLVPMGHKCNSVYKANVDVLWKDGIRRVAINPFGYRGVEIDLKASTLTDGVMPHRPKWEIAFEPNDCQSEMWDEVFDIRTRYCRDVLDVEYEQWIRGFGRWCKDRYESLQTGDELVDAFDDYIDYLREENWNNVAFLKRAVMMFLQDQCRQGHQKIINVLKYFIGGLQSSSLSA